MSRQVAVCRDAERAEAARRVSALEDLARHQQERIDGLRKRMREEEEAGRSRGRTAEARRLVAGLLADGTFREGLYPDLQQVGYDKGFYIQDAAERFQLKVGGLLQVRYTGLNRQSDDPRRPGRQHRDDLSGVEMENLRLVLTGYLHTKKLRYHIESTGDTDLANLMAHV